MSVPTAAKPTKPFRPGEETGRRLQTEPIDHKKGRKVIGYRLGEKETGKGRAALKYSEINMQPEKKMPTINSIIFISKG